MHHLRTDSRRLDAALDGLARETSETGAMQKSMGKLRELMKEIRRCAGRVRDLDVHRELLGKMRWEGDAEAVQEEVALLDAELAERRSRGASELQGRSRKWRRKLAKRTGKLLTAAQEAGDPPVEAEEAELALEIFARLCREMPVLDAGNLHGFRKGAKHARYMAEGGKDAWSVRTAKRLKRVQDAIGMWHDWLVLGEEAREAAGGQDTELVKRIDARRDQQFGSAMKTAGRVRRELLAEWEQFAREKKAGNEFEAGVEVAGRAEWRKSA
jgi:CHAD domain-containing protein